MTLISATQPHPQPLIGVDVGGTTLKFGLVDPSSGDILHQFALPTDAEHGVDAVIARIAEGINRLLGEYPHPIPAIGMGVPGVVNQQGDVCYPPNFPGWEVVPVAKRLAPLLARQLPIAVENDANVAAVAEAQAPGATDRDFLFVTLGTGVGGCIIANGEIWHGATGGAGELGHLSVAMNGQLCNCGARGCVEAYLGQRYMTAAAELRLSRFPQSLLHTMIAEGNELDPKLINTAAEAGDRFTAEFLEEMGEILGAALASAMNLLDIHVVIVGGGVAQAEQFLLEPARRSLRARLLKSIARDAQLRTARFQNNAGIIGAAMLAKKVAGGNS